MMLLNLKNQLYDTLLMVNSDDQYNEFDEYQCTSMLNVNEDSSEFIKIGKRKTNSSVCNTKNASETILNEDVEQKTVLEKSTDQNEDEVEQNTVLEKSPDLNNVKSEQKRSKVNNIGSQKVN